MPLCSFSISKHGNHKVGNTRAGGTGAVTVFTTFSVHTVSRYGICFGLYGLVRFFSLLSDRNGLLGLSTNERVSSSTARNWAFLVLFDIDLLS